MGDPSLTNSFVSSFQDSNGSPCQAMPYERIVETREEANEKLRRFLILCKEDLKLHKAFVGPLKDLETARNKALRDCNGRDELITDYVRGKMVVTTPEEVIAVRQALGDNNSAVMRYQGIHIVQKTDFFEDPKDDTGYRAINYKLAIPVGTNQEYHLVELQVVAAQVEAVYELTHRYKEAAEALFTLSAKEGRPMTKAERRESAYNFAACRLFDGIAARDAGYESLIKPELRGRHGLSKNREQNLRGMVAELDAIHAIIAESAAIAEEYKIFERQGDPEALADEGVSVLER